MTVHPSTKKWLSRILASLLVLAFAASGYGLYRLDEERKALRKEVESLTSRSELLLKKYNEQKAMTDTMRRAMQEVESRARAAVAKVAALEEEKGTLESNLADLEAKMTSLRDSCKEAIASHEERFDALRATFDQLREESNRIILEKNQHINAVTHERDTLDSNLKQETFQHKRCREHNARFAQLAEELVKQYEAKGILGALGQLEPFTQLKKVELEKMCQLYRDKIDDNTL